MTAVFNVAAGGGSLLTIPLLVEMGLSPQSANATNRIGVWVQGVTSSSSFARDGQMPWELALKLLPGSVLGALTGAWVASVLEPQAFRMALAILFAAMGVFLVYRQLGGMKRSVDDADEDAVPKFGPLLALAFFGVGFYGGFIQAGVGIVILLVLHVGARCPLLPSNAIKVLQVVGFSSISLVVFLARGLVDWRAGFWLAAGGMIGGWLGARYASRVDGKWLGRGLIIAVFVASARFAGLI